jgi:hypothetical protein
LLVEDNLILPEAQRAHILQKIYHEVLKSFVLPLEVAVLEATGEIWKSQKLAELV